MDPQAESPLAMPTAAISSSARARLRLPAGIAQNPKMPAVLHIAKVQFSLPVRFAAKGALTIVSRALLPGIAEEAENEQLMPLGGAAQASATGLLNPFEAASSTATVCD